jgi:Zn-dependent alcohol dehydrogenase
MLHDGRFEPRDFISYRITLNEVNDGIAKMRSGRSSIV